MDYNNPLPKIYTIIWSLSSQTKRRSRIFIAVTFKIVQLLNFDQPINIMERDMFYISPGEAMPELGSTIPI